MFQPNAIGVGANAAFGGSHTQSATNTNVVKDFEVLSPPEDSISSLAFSPAALQQNFLVAGSWDNNVRCWEVEQTGTTIPRYMQSCEGPVLDVCWTDDGSKVMMASCDKQVKCWDLASNQTMQVAQHDAPVKTCHWIKSPNYSCLMTGSWDKTLKFWDMRSANPMMTIQLPERCYGAAVDYPMAVVITAGKQVIIYQLEGKPQEFRLAETNLKHQHRCVAIMRDKKGSPTGYAVGSVEGRVAIQYVHAQNPKDNFTFKCQRINGGNNTYQEIYAVNDIAFHPQHNTVATCGSDGTYHFWDKDARTKLRSSEQFDQPISRCCFNHNGQIFAYALSYDWHKGHEYYTPQKKNCIFLHPCYEDAKPRPSSS